jgi:hypothetical protein
MQPTGFVADTLPPMGLDEFWSLCRSARSSMTKIKNMTHSDTPGQMAHAMFAFHGDGNVLTRGFEQLQRDKSNYKGQFAGVQ